MDAGRSIGFPEQAFGPSMLDEMYRALVEHARDIIFLMDENGLIVFANGAAAARYGYSLDEFIGMKVSSVRAPDTRPFIKQQMKEAIRQGCLFETVHITRDGEQFPVEVSSRGVSFGGSRYLLSVVRDISVRAQRQADREALVSDLEIANRQLEGLLSVVSGAIGSLDLDTMLAAVLESLTNVMGAHGSLFLVLEGNELVLRAYHGFDSRCDGFHMRADEGFAGQVAASGQPLWTPDVTRTASPVSMHATYGLKAMYGMPLYLDGALYGVLECAWTDERLVSESERVMLTVAADRIMAALAGVRRYERTVRARMFDSALCRISDQLGSSRDLASTVPAALHIAIEALDCDIAGYGAFDGMRWRAVHGIGITPGTLVCVPGHPEKTREVRELLPVVRIGASSPAATWLAESFGMSEGAIVPVQTGSEWVGAMLFGRNGFGGGFDDLAADFIRRFSSSLSMAFAASREYHAEHRIAETLQEALLRFNETSPGIRLGRLYRSATAAARVGGDFYDVFEIDEDTLGIMIGDVSGKGLEAAVFTTLVKHTVLAFALTHESAADAVALANRVLSSASRLPDFASLILMRIDKRSGEITYCCAGHPPAFIRRSDGRVEALLGGSPVLGVSEELSFDEHVAHVEPGDIVILYTDGITEARAASGEFFGDDRFAEFIAATDADAFEFPERLVECLTRFVDGQLNDDTAIVTFSIDPDGS